MSRIVGTITIGGQPLEVTTDVTLPPPVPSGLAYGASEVAFDQLNTAVSGKLRIRRSYDGAMPSSLAASKAQSDVTAGRIPWVSFSSVASGSMRPFMDSCATASKTVWVAPIHEVDNGPKMGGPQFQDLLGNLMAAKVAAGASKVKIAPILTASPYRKNSDGSPGNWGDWMGGDPGDFDIIGIDPYRFWRPVGAPPDPKAKGLGQSRTMQWLIGDAPAFSASVGKPIAIGEYGAHPFPDDLQNRPRWLAETDTFLKSIGAVGACYFHSGNGESGPWWVDQFHFATSGKQAGDPDPASLAAFRALL